MPSFKSRHFGYLVFLPAIFLSCIRPLELPVRSNEQLMVVDGYITTAPGPHRIRLTKSANYTSFGRDDGVNNTVTNARVHIRSDAGEVVLLPHKGQGIYQTPSAFRGEVGRTYVLTIDVADGDLYSSLPQKIEKVPAIDNLYLRFHKGPSSDGFQFSSGVNVFCEFEDDPDTKDFYMTTFSNGVYPFTTHPELYSCEHFCDCRPQEGMDRCFRYERTYPDVVPTISSVHQCIRKTGDLTRNFELTDDRLFNGNQVVTLASFIEDDGMRFEYAYRTQIDLLRISSDAFGFYNRLASQLSIEGDIFDPPPADIAGNILNFNDPDRNAIGFFGAFDVSSREVYIERDLLEDHQRKFLFTSNCTNLDSASLNVPVDWEGSSW